MHGSDAFKDLEVPQLDSHVCRAGCEQFASMVKRDVLHRIRVALQCAFKVSALIVPHLEDNVFMHLHQRNPQHIQEHTCCKVQEWATHICLKLNLFATLSMVPKC